MNARGSDNRVWLAQQNDFERCKGFSLNLENSAPDGPLRLATLKIVLGIGDGKAWRYIEHTPAWRLDKDYTIQAVVSPGVATVFLDGVLIGESKGAFEPAEVKADSFRTPGWANSPAEYLVNEASLSLRTDTGRKADARWPAQTPGTLALRMFEPQSPKRIAWTTRSGETLTVIAKVRLTKAPDIRTLAPFVDRYGQPVHSEFPGKVKSDADLKAAIADEASHTGKWVRSTRLDRFGGRTDAGWTGGKSGYFSVTKRNGYWWMLSPEGNPLFYVGLCTVDRAAWERTPVTGREYLFAELPPRDGAFEQAWAKSPWGWNDNVDYVSFYTANMVRKYGPDWYAKTAPAIRRRLDAWGFTGVSKWSDATLEETPNIAVIYYPGVPTLAAHPDVFDPAVQAAFKETLRKQVEPRKTDPWLVGWSVGNERDEIILKSEITGILSKPSSPAKRAIIDSCLDKTYSGDVSAAATAWKITAGSRDELYASTPAPNDADVELMRHTFADKYYGFLYETVKGLDPNHLYFGFWVVPWWWENQSDWALAAAHCDVLGYDLYSETFSTPDMDRWMREAGKPILCGEFSFPPFENGRRGLGVYSTVSTEDNRDAAGHYRRWLHDAAANPYCVGAGYFQYRDQPVTGRGPGAGANLVIGEHYAFGLVDITDRPKWDLIDSVRTANLAATATRLVSGHPLDAQPGGSLPKNE
jgi:hypothetical protein